MVAYRPGGRPQAHELRPAARDARKSCGFCEGGHGQPRGVCQDVDGRCKGTWPDFVRATAANPEGSWTGACSAAGHATRLGSMCRFAV